MKIHLLAIFWFGSLAFEGNSTAEEMLHASDSTFGLTNSSLIENLNITSANSVQGKGLENITGISLQETNSKPGNMTINTPLVQKTGLLKQDASTIITKEQQIIHNNDAISNLEHEEDKSNQTTSTRSSVIQSKPINEEFRNVTRGDGEKVSTILSPKQYEIQEAKNISQPPSLFSISPRSKFKLKLIHRNQDFARDCFDDLRKYMGSKACYKVQCTDDGVKFIIWDEEAEIVKPVVEFDVGRGLRSTNNCINVPGVDPSIKICIKWTSMKWSKTNFRGCVSSKVSDESEVIRKTTLTCYKINCEDHKWGNKWLISRRDPQSGSETHGKKPTFSRPSTNPNLDANANVMRAEDGIYSIDQLDVEKPFEEEQYTTSRVFDYIETLPPQNIGNRPPTRVSHSTGRKPKPGNRREQKNTPKLWTTLKPGHKKSKRKPKAKPQQQKKQKPQHMPPQKNNKPTPKTKPQQQNKPELGSKPPEKKNEPKPITKPQQQNKQKPQNKPPQKKNKPTPNPKKQQQNKHKLESNPPHKQNKPTPKTKKQQRNNHKIENNPPHKQNKPTPKTKKQQQNINKLENNPPYKQNKPTPKTKPQKQKDKPCNAPKKHNEAQKQSNKKLERKPQKQHKPTPDNKTKQRINSKLGTTNAKPQKHITPKKEELKPIRSFKPGNSHQELEQHDKSQTSSEPCTTPARRKGPIIKDKEEKKEHVLTTPNPISEWIKEMKNNEILDDHEVMKDGKFDTVTSLITNHPENLLPKTKIFLLKPQEYGF